MTSAAKERDSYRKQEEAERFQELKYWRAAETRAREKSQRPKGKIATEKRGQERYQQPKNRVASEITRADELQHPKDSETAENKDAKKASGAKGKVAPEKSRTKIYSVARDAEQENHLKAVYKRLDAEEMKSMKLKAGKLLKRGPNKNVF